MSLAKTTKRPILISILCVAGFIFSAGQIILISSPSIRSIAGWYPIVYGLITAARFISFVGVWNMKKWAAEMFLYVSLLKIIIQLLVHDSGVTSWADAGISLTFAIIFLSYYKRMDRNL
ncbi:MAG TPA: hypothetical protein VFU15_02955 [Bacteroidia bacterium]|nr:hypothetical protein [Bacteroidia bacterium]